MEVCAFLEGYCSFKHREEVERPHTTTKKIKLANKKDSPDKKQDTSLT